MATKRSSLSVVCSALHRYSRQVQEAYDDPINRYYGVQPPPQPAKFRAIAEEHGWILNDVIAEVERRTTPRVAHDFCGHWECETV